MKTVGDERARAAARLASVEAGLDEQKRELEQEIRTNREVLDAYRASFAKYVTAPLAGLRDDAPAPAAATVYLNAEERNRS